MTGYTPKRFRLAALRKVRGLTQTDVGDHMGKTQTNVSRLEAQGDMLVSTLALYVAATGGALRLVAKYPSFELDIDLPGEASGKDEPQPVTVEEARRVARQKVRAAIEEEAL